MEAADLEGRERHHRRAPERRLPRRLSEERADLPAVGPRRCDQPRPALVRRRDAARHTGRFSNEGIRGLAHDRATSFPAQLGVASSWDRALVEEIGSVTGREARALGYTNVYSPILDLPRDPRWGRTVEAYSEDPFLASELGRIQVRALQAARVVSTPKHFAIYSIPKGGRDGATRTDPQATLREVEMIYLPPFKAAIQEAGALGVMSSYNDYDGVTITASRHFLTDLLRRRWGFKGYVVSDSRAVEFIESKHQTAFATCCA
ncbi:MAG TPA: glycoside hydrolase family 3 N-terminal domain-containing protein [Vicinamibacterales bacterium]|nr:glycoside hydrolase family 3 N-terminal domain-containing protein [Vicinamibacterales bacterium]